MPILNLPNVPYVKGEPKLIRSVSQSRAGNRVISNIEFADPYWLAEVQSAPITRAQRAEMLAFIDQASSGMNTILFAPSYLGVPQAYWNDPGNAAIGVNGSVVSITNGTQIAINSVINGLKLNTGDWLGLEKDGYRSLHRVIVGGTAAAGAISLTVEPPVPGYITAGAVAKFKGVGMNARMVPGSESVADDYLAVASFTVVEVPK